MGKRKSKKMQVRGCGTGGIGYIYNPTQNLPTPQPMQFVQNVNGNLPQNFDNVPDFPQEILGPPTMQSNLGRQPSSITMTHVSYGIPPGHTPENVLEEVPLKRRIVSTSVVLPENPSVEHLNQRTPQMKATKTIYDTRPILPRPNNYGIISYDYPNTIFNEEQFEKIQMAIFEKLEATEGVPPFINMRYITPLGVIPVECKGEANVSFLKSLNGLLVSGNIKLKVVRENDIPQCVKLLWRSRNIACTDFERVTKMVERCNPTLNTSLWKLLETFRGNQFVGRLVVVDMASFNYIKSNKYSIPDGIGNSLFGRDRAKYKKLGCPDLSKNNKSDLEETVKNCSQNDLTNKNKESICAEKIGSKKRHSWGEIIELNHERVPPIDLTEENSSHYDDEEDFTGEL